MTPADRQKILKECWDKSLHAYGYAYLYEKRYERYRNWLRFSTFLGFAVPISIGGIYAGYSTNGTVLGWTLTIGAALGVIQLLISLLSLTNGWNESLSHSSESKAGHHDLFREFETLAKFKPSSDEELKSRFSVLSTIERSREQQDAKNPLSAKDKREGMRYALRYFKRECSTCGTMPISMTPTKCDTCGNF